MKRQNSFYIPSSLNTNTVMDSLISNTIANGMVKNEASVNESSTNNDVVPCSKYNSPATHIINLADNADITGCDLPELFKVKEQLTRYMGGTMINFTNQCFFITNPTLQYTKIHNNIFNKSEETIMIADPCLCKAFNDLTQYIIRNTKLHSNAEGYVCIDNKCYLSLSPNLTIFDKNKNLIPYNATLWMDDQHHEIKFLIQVYGAYVYECGGQEKLKISAKIVQMQLFELGLPYKNSAILQTCLM